MFTKYIIPNFIVAAAYNLAGFIGLFLFVIPPSNAAAIWPASGVALASVLILGKRVLPGVFIGNFILECIIFLDTSSITSIFSSMVLPACIATGALCQCYVGVKITQNIIKDDEALLKEKSILLFAVLTGLVAGMISASIAVMSLWLLGVLNSGDLLITWSTWWAGDAIGILVFTPLLLCFFGKPRYFWKQRIITVALPLLFLSSISFIIFKMSFQHELKYLEEVFEADSTRFKNELIESIETHRDLTLELKEFYDSSVEVSFDEFNTYTEPKLIRYPEIKALEWIAAVDHKDRDAFEYELGGPIKIPSENKVMINSPDRDIYYVIQYVKPYTGNENALGYDIRHNAKAKVAAERACKSGQVSITDPINIVQDDKKLISLVTYAPVYKKSNNRNKTVNCDNILGFTASVFQLELRINELRKETYGRELLVELRNNSETVFRDNEYQVHEQFVARLKKRYTFSIANQQYEIIFRPTEHFFTRYSSWTIWLILVSGILVSGLFGVGLLMMTGRGLRTEELVQLRTKELNSEILERKHSAQLLTLENKYLEMIAQDFTLQEITDTICLDVEEMSPDSICSISITDVSKKFLKPCSAPNLPELYKKALDIIDIGPNVGSCGTAAYLNKPIIVGDIETNPLWQDYKSIALKYGLKACWSVPVTVLNKEVLGTLALYYKEIREEDPVILDLLQRMANVVAIAILRKQTEDKLNFHANHDALTGLVNRREFERRVQRILEFIKDDDEYAICFLDLDQFKVVNDTCGHVAGDELLRQLTSELEKVVRKRDTLARLGGDEFGVLMEHCSLNDANRVATSILSAIQNYQFIWEEHSFKVGVSIGLVPVTQSTPDFNQILKDADAACYMAKELGRNRIHVFSADDENLAKRSGEVKWVSQINNALDNDLFSLYAQAIVPLENSSGIHYELLIRLVDGNDGFYPPGAFLPAAERYNLIKQLDRWVIHNAFTQLVENPTFLKDISFCSINLSGQTISSEETLDFIISQLKETNIDGHKICFEITETAAISNLSIAMEFISKLKEMGCQFALDDFGSGLSSFAYLKNLPVDYLKIDGMFVKDIADDPIDHAMVKSINEIGQVMGMETIAEFVENDIIKGMLKEIGVNYAQGYGISKPEPFDEILKNHNKNS